VPLPGWVSGLAPPALARRLPWRLRPVGPWGGRARHGRREHTPRGGVSGKTRGSADLGAPDWRCTAGTRGGGAAAGLPLVARKTWPDPPGAPTTVARAKCRTPRGGGRACRAGAPGAPAVARRALQAGGPAGGDGGPRRPRQRGGAGHGPPPAGRSPGVCLGRGGGGRQSGRRRAGPRAAEPPATALALSCPALSCGGRQLSHKAGASRASAPGGGAPGGGPLAPRGPDRGLRARRGRARGAWPGPHRASRGVGSYRHSPGLSGAAYHRGARLSREQAARRQQPGVARKAGTDGGVSQAHGRWCTGIRSAPAARPAVSPRSPSATPRAERSDRHAHGSRGVRPLCPREARAVCGRPEPQPPGPWLTSVSAHGLYGGGDRPCLVPGTHHVAKFVDAYHSPLNVG